MPQLALNLSQGERDSTSSQDVKCRFCDFSVPRFYQGDAMMRFHLRNMHLAKLLKIMKWAESASSIPPKN